MVADSDHPSIPARRLAERLRGLREQEHLTQKQLARVLGGRRASRRSPCGKSRARIGCLRLHGLPRTPGCSVPAGHSLQGRLACSATMS